MLWKPLLGHRDIIAYAQSFCFTRSKIDPHPPDLGAFLYEDNPAYTKFRYNHFLV